MTSVQPLPEPSSFQFVFQNPREWDVVPPRLWREPWRDRNQPDEVLLRPSEAMSKIGRYYLSATPQVKQGPRLAFPFPSGSLEEDRLVACVMLLDLTLKCHEELGDDDWWTRNMLGLEEREYASDAFRFNREARDRHISLWDFNRTTLNRRRERWGAITFAMPPMQFYRPDAYEALQWSQIYVLKRFTTPDLLVLSSCILGSMRQQAQQAPQALNGPGP